MFITGYHGTTESAARSILSDGEFHISNNDNEWLGDGIYFYFDINDALLWRDSEIILHSVIYVERDEYLDIESDVGNDIYNQARDMLCRKYNTELSILTESERQCAVMRLIWDAYTQIKVISCSFASEKSKIKTLYDPRVKRREFCVRNNDSIKAIYPIRKDVIL